MDGFDDGCLGAGTYAFSDDASELGPGERSDNGVEFASDPTRSVRHLNIMLGDDGVDEVVGICEGNHAKYTVDVDTIIRGSISPIDSQKRTGYGLSIVKQIVESHGWNIWTVEGSEGGARFEITGENLVDE
ncbi:ATP-binding protein [Halovenus rubra]|uniref:ATP-binding protein n=2 Tax=Halovenus rubra TaxID=869890 RepID=A0ACC7DY82_9EURY|nr:ATP-binding protein [Halovenus rubra]